MESYLGISFNYTDIDDDPCRISIDQNKKGYEIIYEYTHLNFNGEVKWKGRRKLQVRKLKALINTLKDRYHIEEDKLEEIKEFFGGNK